MQIVKVTQIKNNPRNPRIIKDDSFKKLVQSIIDFPDMLNKRPLVCFTDIDKKYVVLGGNMRLKASIEAGLKEVPIMLADNWTEEQKREFIIKDNVGFGEWDYADLMQNWEYHDLDNWGLTMPNFDNSNDVDYSDKNKEIDIDSLDGEMIIKLKYSENDYNYIKSKLYSISDSPEDAVKKLLENYEL